MGKKVKFCPAMWLSGFFGLGALVHVVRLITRVSVAINGKELPLSFSGFLVVILGFLSIGLLIVSLKKPCESDNKGENCCK